MTDSAAFALMRLVLAAAHAVGGGGDLLGLRSARGG